MSIVINLPSTALSEAERRTRPLFCQNLHCRCPLEYPEHGVLVKFVRRETQEIVEAWFGLCCECFCLFNGQNARMVPHSPVTESNFTKRGMCDDR